MEDTIKQLLGQSILETDEMLDELEIVDGIEPVMFQKGGLLVDSIIK